MYNVHYISESSLQNWSDQHIIETLMKTFKFHRKIKILHRTKLVIEINEKQ